jgi:phenylalanyl-tRNA synthetase beta chain
MTIITFDRKELEKKIGKIDEKMEERISMFGTVVEDLTEDEVSVEVFPNRPDLLSFGGFVRGLLGFFGKGKGLKNYNVNKPLENYNVVIDKSVKSVRPFTACAIVKNLKLDDARIKEMIDIQEKLHGSYGRNRKKLAIGIYPLEEIKLPIKFLARKPEEIKFQPLEFPRAINGRQILSQHPAGREYGDLLKGAEVFPIFEDANGEILSMPPIINSEKTGKVGFETKDVFIECSGFNLDYLKKTLNMIVCALADMGGEIYEMEIVDKRKWVSPDLSSDKMEFSLDDLNKTLGLELSVKEVKGYLGKMGIGYGEGVALVPCYRTDILHEIDLSEEVAIAYGYENFEAEIPEISTIGCEDKVAVLKRRVDEILAGLGLLEVSSYHLSTKDVQFKKICKKGFLDEVIEVLDSKTENNILRTSLFANSMKILSENSDASYPQKIFELGKVFGKCEGGSGGESGDGSQLQRPIPHPPTRIGGVEIATSGVGGIVEKERLCISLCGEGMNFTELKQVLDYLMRMLGVEYSLEEVENESFIVGRCGSVVVGSKGEEGVGEKRVVGVMGEVGLSVLKNNKIKMPVVSLELDLSCFVE